jgi:hypothetical protein
MADNYKKIVDANLAKLYADPPHNLAERLPASQKEHQFIFEAFGGVCRIAPQGIHLDDELQTSVIGILLSLYALSAAPAPCILEPFKAYKDFPDSMPYTGAFASHTEQILVPQVSALSTGRGRILQQLNGYDATDMVAGDVAFVVYPLPKIALCYIFYAADEDFSASVTCLFSNNANLFLPMDALADVGEYTSKKILTLLESATPRRR